MPTVKAANYTGKQVEEMREEYEKAGSQETRDAVVKSIADKFGKSPRSIVAKMSREGFYIAKVVVSKVTGEKPMSKSDLVVKLRDVSGLVMVSGEKLNKTDIQDLIEAFTVSEDAEVEMVEAGEIEAAQA